MAGLKPETSEYSDTSDRELVATRVFDAPRSLVFRAWTSPDHVGHWWGPRGFTTTTYAMDVKPGGVWRYTMHGPDGVDYENEITYVEVVEPDRIVYDMRGVGTDDLVVFRAFITFEDVNGKTRLTKQIVFPTAEDRDVTVEKYGAAEGLVQTLDRLSEYMAETAAPDPATRTP